MSHTFKWLVCKPDAKASDIHGSLPIEFKQGLNSIKQPERIPSILKNLHNSSLKLRILKLHHFEIFTQCLIFLCIPLSAQGSHIIQDQKTFEMQAHVDSGYARGSFQGW